MSQKIEGNAEFGMIREDAISVPDLIDFLKNLIFSEDFLSRHRSSPKDFIRTRLLPFHRLIYFLLNIQND